HAMTGDQAARAGALGMAVVAMATLEGYDEDIGALETSLRLHGVYGEWFVERGELDKAVEVQGWALTVARRLIGLDDGPRRRFELAVVQRQVGRSASLTGDAQSAGAELLQACANLRELLAQDTSVTLEIQLVSTLDDLADVYMQEERLDEAEPL